LIDTIFLGSPGELLTQLVADHDLSSDDLKRLAEQLSVQERMEGER
jgi:hypothetical protein